MPATSGPTVTVHTSFTVDAIPAATPIATTATLTVTGWLRPTTHEAHLTLHLDQPPTDAVLDTRAADVTAARSQVDAIVAAVNSGDWTTLAGLLAPDITDGDLPGQLADAFSGSGITHADLKPVGPGRLTRLPSGDPAWLQNYTLTARNPAGRPLTQHGALVLVEENRTWWLLDAGAQARTHRVTRRSWLFDLRRGRLGYGRGRSARSARRFHRRSVGRGRRVGVSLLLVVRSRQ